MAAGRPKRSLGVLNDPFTDEVPGELTAWMDNMLDMFAKNVGGERLGSVLLIRHSARNEPLGLDVLPAHRTASSLPSPIPPSPSQRRASHVPASPADAKKTTADGKIILDPQPADSLNDPLNWPSWRRDAALLSLGFYCMLGGGMTPVLAAGFQNVADSYNVSIAEVALTTGLYMMGLGLGSVVASPTAIIWGKRPVYLVGIILYILSAVWCALSPNYASLVVARVFMGIAVSPCECLPSATIAEIFYLHERAYRLGVYTLLLLSGKNLVPLVSAVIIQSLDWRWVFWIVAIIVGLCFVLMFLLVPETFFDRTPRPSHHSKLRLASISAVFHPSKISSDDGSHDLRKLATDNASRTAQPTIAERRHRSNLHHVAFASSDEKSSSPAAHSLSDKVVPRGDGPQTPALHGFNSPTYHEKSPDAGYFDSNRGQSVNSPATVASLALESGGPMPYCQTLRPWNGKLRREKWLHVAARPFILFAYPAILWSTLVYSLSIGWLIVLSEAVSVVYRSRETYNFTSLQAGLVYIAPFVGGVLGTAVAGKVSDIIVRFMSRRNGGLYEPEFRLVMAIPVALSTVLGLVGFGWSVDEHDSYMVPTVFFGVISFGCSLGSTTAITFAVDSYRQYAGEALVTLNFSKNIFHGLVFSLFFNHWLETDGPKTTFAVIGGIQMLCLFTTVPMYIYGKRARMWTVRKNLMEKF